MSERTYLAVPLSSLATLFLHNQCAVELPTKLGEQSLSDDGNPSPRFLMLMQYLRWPLRCTLGAECPQPPGTSPEGRIGHPVEHRPFLSGGTTSLGGVGLGWTVLRHRGEEWNSGPEETALVTDREDRYMCGRGRGVCRSFLRLPPSRASFRVLFDSLRSPEAKMASNTTSIVDA